MQQAATATTESKTSEQRSRSATHKTPPAFEPARLLSPHANPQPVRSNQALLRMRQDNGLRPHMTPLRPSQSVGVLQRQCSCGGGTGLSADAECPECAAKRETALQRKAAGAAAPVNPAKPASAPPIVHDVLKSSGSPQTVQLRLRRRLTLQHSDRLTGTQ